MDSMRVAWSESVNGGKMRYFTGSDVGKIRKNNEDYIYANSEMRLFVVADGMGGHNAGEVASKETVESFVERFMALDERLEQRMIEALIHANAHVYELAKSNEAYEGMGTTFSALCFDKTHAVIVHVGDSRIYRISDKKIMQVTTDHTLPYELLQMGRITEEEYHNHPDTHKISKAVGTQRALAPEHMSIEISLGDVFVLASDGLTDLVDEESIFQKVEAIDSPEIMVESLLKEAMHAGGNDNVSVICIILDNEKELNEW
jgi:protein phosphatase